MKRFRVLLMVGLVAAWAFALAGGAFAQERDPNIPADAPEDCVEEVMDLPALNVCKDAQGRHLLDLPAIGTLREPLPSKQPAAAYGQASEDGYAHRGLHGGRWRRARGGFRAAAPPAPRGVLTT